jgi:hypothetical protein
MLANNWTLTKVIKKSCATIADFTDKYLHVRRKLARNPCTIGNIIEICPKFLSAQATIEKYAHINSKLRHFIRFIAGLCDGRLVNVVACWKIVRNDRGQIVKLSQIQCNYSQLQAKCVPKS